MFAPSNITDGVHRIVDVLIVGGGPTGLTLSHSLIRAGLNVLTVEQYDKAQQATYGRGCVLYARSLEILDQLGLYDLVADIGYIIRGAVTYRGREQLDTRGWTSIQKAVDGNTNFEFCFGIRQKMLEEAFRNAIQKLDTHAIQSPAKLVDFSVDMGRKHPVVSNVDIDGTITKVHSKFLIGADGGHSTVRSLAGIPFPGTASPFRWIRLDAIVRTDMPAGRRGAVSVESPSYGNILWTPIDNGRTRIGFVCPDELYGENGESIDANAVMIETQKALKPFTVDFIRLDWWTVYNIGQHVAERFKEGPILLAGDAAHTHSSGAAQGMNTGIHDASNLSWKLAGVLKGWYTDAVLDTYSTERRASAQQLIRIDKDVSSLISGVIPAHFNAPPDVDANLFLEEVLQTSANFTVGLGIHYEENLINQHSQAQNIAAKSLRVGHRAPDPPLFCTGSQYPKRLQELTPNREKLWILLFVGGLDPDSSQPRLRQYSIDRFTKLRSYFEGTSSFANALVPTWEFLTIIRADGVPQAAEALDGQPLGRVVYDKGGTAYAMYGVDESAGAVIVLRPDGIVGFMTSMGQYEAIAGYLTRFVRPVVQCGPKVGQSHVLELGRC